MILQNIGNSSSRWSSSACAEVKFSCDEGFVAGDEDSVVKTGRGVQGRVKAGNSSSLAELGERDAAGCTQGLEAWVVAVCSSRSMPRAA
jgi:hypothetical protein